MDLKNKTILFQGDSITDAGRDREVIDEPNKSLGSGYVAMTSGAILSRYASDDIKIYNRGIGGNWAEDLWERWQKDCLDIKPDILSILVGVNGLKESWSRLEMHPEITSYAVALEKILQMVKDELPDTKIIIGQPFVLTTGLVDDTWVDKLKVRQKVAKELANKFGAIFIPYQDMFNDALSDAPKSYWLEDGVHPTLAGYKRMSDIWLESVGI